MLLNLARGLSFVVAFFNVATWRAVGFAWAWSAFAIVLLLFWLPVLALAVGGERWRARLGHPAFHAFM